MMVVVMIVMVKMINMVEKVECGQVRGRGTDKGDGDDVGIFSPKHCSIQNPSSVA